MRVNGVKIKVSSNLFLGSFGFFSLFVDLGDDHLDLFGRHISV
jgi:hypothetical protein